MVTLKVPKISQNREAPRRYARFIFLNLLEFNSNFFSDLLLGQTQHPAKVAYRFSKNVRLLGASQFTLFKALLIYISKY